MALARRHGRFVLPLDARGGRQPVHAGDLADAAFACIGNAVSIGRAYALPGGETLDYVEMVRHVLGVFDPSSRLHLLPMPLFRLALLAARASGRLDGFNDAMLVRMREDLVFDAGPARRDFGYAPRVFKPDATMFATG